MTRLKLMLLAAACALFALACATNTTTNTSTVSNGNRTVTNNTAAANTGSTNTPATAVTDATAEARNSYNAACVKCHKENGEGGVIDIDGDKLRVPSFKGGHALKHADEGYFKQISEGGEGMPKFKDRLTPAQINGLVRFIRTEFQAGLTTGSAANSNANK